MAKKKKTKHPWKFFRVAGFDQVQIRDGEDLASLEDLDPKLWVAIACPAKDIELDAHTVSLLDTDADGRIRVKEVIAAAKWLSQVLVDAGDVLAGKGELPITSISTETAEGKSLRASARRILDGLGKPEAKAVTPADTLDTAAIFAKTMFNGDGIVPPESAGDDAKTAAVIKDILTVLGADKDASGKDGVSKDKVERFFKEATAWADWWKSGEDDAATRPLGDKTAAAHAAYAAVRDKVNDYYTRCALAAMDERAAGPLNASEGDLATLAKETLSPSTAGLAALPIAKVGPNRELPLRDGVNPAFAAAVAAFRTDCVVPFLGERTGLTHADWKRIEEKLAAHVAWLGKRQATPIEKLGGPRLIEIVSSDTRAKVDALMAQDLAVEAEAKAIAGVDKLVHLHRDFGTLVRNFVSFEDFYGRRRRALFQTGTLYMDGRSFELCLRVTDAAKHGALASLSLACLAYCDITRGAEKRSIVAAITNGDSDFLIVGRNGVFYDRTGNEWDATITKIVEQPISVRQAFWSPYKKVARFVNAQIERLAGERAAASDAMLEQAATATVPPSGAPPAPAPAPPAAGSAQQAQGAFDAGKFAGIFAAIGLALGAIGTAVAAVVTGFLGLTVYQIPLAVAGALLAVSGPSMLLAALKLRQRNLGPLLDAGGWAINTRAKINIPFGAALTDLAALPPGASRSLADPYAEKKKWWKTPLLILMVLGVGAYLVRAELAGWLRPHVQEVPILRGWVGPVEEAEEPEPAEPPTRATPPER